METTIGGIPPGTYSVAAFQDRDSSGRLKRNFLGMPQEDLGFSRDPSLRFGPPSFAATLTLHALLLAILDADMPSPARLVCHLKSTLGTILADGM